MGVRLWYFALLFACAFVVWRRSGREERWATAALVAGSIATNLLFALGAGDFRSVRIGPVVVDFATFLALVWIALWSRRYWPMLVAAFQLVAVSTHLGMLIDGQIVPRAYAVGLAFWIYPMLTLIVWASLSRRQNTPANEISSQL